MEYQTFNNLPDNKKKRIFRIVLNEFSEKGYNGTSINVIVKKLGIAKGSIFQYFGDKKGLFLFIFLKSIEMVKEYLRKVRSETLNEPLFERLKKTLLAGYVFIKKNPEIYNLYIKMLVESDIPYRDDILKGLRENSFNYIKSLLNAAKKNNELLESLDLNKVSFIIDAVMDRFLQTLLVENFDANLGIFGSKKENIENWIDELVDIIKSGIKSGNTI